MDDGEVGEQVVGGDGVSRRDAVTGRIVHLLGCTPRGSRLTGPKVPNRGLDLDAVTRRPPASILKAPGPEVEMVQTMISTGARIECSQCRALIECRRVRRIGVVVVATCTVCGGLEAVPQLRVST